MIKDTDFTNSCQQSLHSRLLTRLTTNVTMHSKDSFQPRSKTSKSRLHRSYTS